MTRQPHFTLKVSLFSYWSSFIVHIKLNNRVFDFWINKIVTFFLFTFEWMELVFFSLWVYTRRVERFIWIEHDMNTSELMMDKVMHKCVWIIHLIKPHRLPRHEKCLKKVKREKDFRMCVCACGHKPLGFSTEIVFCVDIMAHVQIH